VPARHTRAAGVAATVAALAATAGDLLLLWVANAARPELRGLPPPPPGSLVAGYYLGVLAIPLYGLGYWQVAEDITPGGRRAARAVFFLGLAGGVVGGVVHGVTGLVIHADHLLGAAGEDPLAVVARHGAFLLPLWGLLGVLVVGGSILYARAVLGGSTRYSRWMAALNPALLVAVLGALATASPRLEAFLLPAAPNVAHVLFFAATTLVPGADRGAPPIPA